jgi:hypothetical protein
MDSYTLGTKTAASIPDEVFKEAERLAWQQAMDAALAEIGHEGHGFVRSTGRRVLRSSEW